MRWLFLFVLLLNIAYITSELGKVPEAERFIKVIDSHIPPLVLISELERTMDQPQELVVKQAVVEKVTLDKVGDSEKSVITEKREKKKTVATKESTQTKLAKKTEESTINELKPEQPADVCYTLGPFRELDKLRVFTRQIKNYVTDVSFRSREEQEVSLFWVYLPPEADIKFAHKLSKRLIGNKIRDYYIITSGPKSNGISLGHFKNKKSAFTHAKRLKKLGFNPVVETVFRTYIIYWLDYRVKPDQQIPDEVFGKHMTARMNKLNRECVQAL